MADKFVIDTSSLIDLFRYYPPEMNVFKPIWDKIEHILREGMLFSHIEVKRELKQKDDDISKWSENHNKIFLEDLGELGETIKDVREKYDENYWANEIKRRAWADPWVITTAKLLKIRSTSLRQGCDVKIVTEEMSGRNKIPDIAKQVGIETVRLLDFFREIGIE